MCGRFNIITDTQALVEAFEILYENVQVEPFAPRYNISPSKRETAIQADNPNITTIPVVLHSDNGLVLRNAIWPLVPIWAKGVIPKYSTANARSETMAELRSFRHSWNHARRCLIPATGFYEWQLVPGSSRKQPWHIQHKNQKIMSFAGLWEPVKLDDETTSLSCTIVTTQANELMSEIHNSNHRMPVIVDPESRDKWLVGDAETAFDLTRTYPDGMLDAYPISTWVNNPHADSVEIIEPKSQDKPEQQLF